MEYGMDRFYHSGLESSFFYVYWKNFFQGVCVDVKDPEGRKIIYDVRYHLWKITLFKKNIVNFSQGRSS